MSRTTYVSSSPRSRATVKMHEADVCLKTFNVSSHNSWQKHQIWGSARTQRQELSLDARAYYPMRVSSICTVIQITPEAVVIQADLLNQLVRPCFGCLLKIGFFPLKRRRSLSFLFLNVFGMMKKEHSTIRARPGVHNSHKEKNSMQIFLYSHARCLPCSGF